jgi:hypothetical protein
MPEEGIRDHRLSSHDNTLGEHARELAELKKDLEKHRDETRKVIERYRDEAKKEQNRLDREHAITREVVRISEGNINEVYEKIDKTYDALVNHSLQEEKDRNKFLWAIILSVLSSLGTLVTLFMKSHV